MCNQSKTVLETIKPFLSEKRAQDDTLELCSRGAHLQVLSRCVLSGLVEWSRYNFPVLAIQISDIYKYSSVLPVCVLTQEEMRESKRTALSPLFVQLIHTNYYKIVKQFKSFKIIIVAPTRFGLHIPSSGSSQPVLR